MFQITSACSYAGFTAAIIQRTNLVFLLLFFSGLLSSHNAVWKTFLVLLAGRNMIIMTLYPYNDINTDKLPTIRSNICNNFEFLEDLIPCLSIIDMHIATVDKYVA